MTRGSDVALVRPRGERSLTGQFDVDVEIPLRDMDAMPALLQGKEVLVPFGPDLP